MTEEELANHVRDRLSAIAGYADTWILTEPRPDDLRDIANMIEAFQLGAKITH